MSHDTRSGTPGGGPSEVTVVVLAAGAGTRMRSARPKVLHEVAGKPMLWHAVRAADVLRPRSIVVVLGHGREEVGRYLAAAPDLPAVEVAVQDEQLGTGHALQCALAAAGPFPGTVVVTMGDVPLLQGSTLTELADRHAAQGNAVTVLTALVADPTGYGRLVRDRDGAPERIVEHRDADPAQRAIQEINSGVYAFDGPVLTAALAQLSAQNAAGELYLTDVLAIARADGHRVGAVLAPDATETEGVNDRVQLSRMAAELNARLVRQAQLAGATVLDPASTWLHADVTVGPDSTLLPGTSLEAGTQVGAGCTIGPATTLRACTVADGASVVRTHAEGARIGERATVGPFSFLRPGADLGAGSKVGAYVEVKGSTIGPGAKVPHLSYVGDATIGAATNLGAGVITANYDGVTKSPTVVGAHAFIGTNSTLVAPVTVADGAYVAAGSTITVDVAAGDLAVARQRQSAIRGWVLRRRAGTRAAAAATAALPGDGAADPATDAAPDPAPDPATAAADGAVRTG